MEVPTDRTRSYTVVDEDTVSWLTYFGPNGAGSYHGHLSMLAGSRALSIEHPGFRKELGGSKDIGGPFWTQGVNVTQSDNFKIYHLGAGAYRYDGPLLPHLLPYSYPTPWPCASSPSSVNTLIGKGTDAIADTIPTAPAFNVAQFVGELREGLPSIMGSQFVKSGLPDLARASGGEFLNFQFAVKPYLSDIRKFLLAVRNMNYVLEQYMRDSGRRIRRTRKFPLEVTESDPIPRDGGVAFFTPGIGALNSYLQQSDSAVYITGTSKSQWFSGEYEYYIPDIDLDKWGYYSSLANKLLGLRITPQVLWDLSPWTWMLDWFGNVGSLMTNLSYLSADSLVLHYGYIMETSSSYIKYIGKGRIKTLGVGWEDLTLTTVYEAYTKQRLAAHPYGFAADFNLGSLTPLQFEILAALGASRSPRALTF